MRAHLHMVVAVLLAFGPVRAHGESFDHAANFSQLPADAYSLRSRLYHHWQYQSNYDFAKYTGHQVLLAKFNRHLPAGRGLTILQAELKQTPADIGTVKRLVRSVASDQHSRSVANVLSKLEDGWWAYTKYRTFSPELDSFHTINSGDLRKYFPNMSAANGYYPATDYENNPVTPAKLLNVSNTLGGSSALLVRQLDKFIEENDLVACTAQSSLVQGNWTTSGMSYNSMVVEQKFGNWYNNDGAKLNDHGKPRYKPDIVARSFIDATSWSTPVVCSAAAVLLERAKVDTAVANAWNSVVIKAVLMAGATRFNYRISLDWASQQEIADPPANERYPLFLRGDWERPSDALPTSPKYGAGHLNILAAYDILHSGEFNPGGTSSRARLGWDYASGLAVADVKSYSITLDHESVFSAVLVWHRYIDDTFTSFLPDYQLNVYDSGNRRVAHSDSRTSNVELVEAPLPAGTYRLDVKVKSDGGSTDGLSYGLAWTAKKIAPAPQNPGFSALGHAWTLNWGVTGTAADYKYRVQISTDSGFSTLEKDVYLDGNTYIYLPPADLSARYFRVFTYPLDGDVPYTYPSSPTSAMTLTAEAGDGEAMLRWNRNRTAVSGDYQLKPSGGSWSVWKPIGSFGIRAAWLVGELANGTPYAFRVRAVNSSGQAVSTVAVATPAGPSNSLVKPTVAAVAGNWQVTLSWPADSAATGWEIQRREPDGRWGLWRDTGSAATGYVATSLNNGDEYAFRVRAVGSNGIKGAASDLVRATPGSAQSEVVPAKPTGLTVKLVSATSVRLEWIGEVTVAKWQYRHKLSGGEWSDWMRMGNQSGYTRFTVEGLVDAGSRIFQVRGVNASDTAGPASDEATVDPVPVPETLAAVDAASIGVVHNGGSLSVSWSAPSGATAYDVTYQGNGVDARAAWNRAGTNLTIICDIRPGYDNCIGSQQSYSVGIRARSATGESAWVYSTVASPPGGTPPGSVTNIQVTHNGSSLSASWDAPADATHYDVTFQGNGIDSRAAWFRAGTSLMITCDIRPGHSNCVSSQHPYSVGVRARNAGGESAWTYSTQASPP